MSGDALIELAKASPLLAAGVTSIAAGIKWGPDWLRVIFSHRRKVLRFRAETDKTDKKIRNAIADRKKGKPKPPSKGTAVPPTPPKGGKKARPSKVKN